MRTGIIQQVSCLTANNGAQVVLGKPVIPLTAVARARALSPVRNRVGPPLITPLCTAIVPETIARIDNDPHSAGSWTRIWR